MRASLCKRGVVILAGITTAAKEKRKGVSGWRGGASKGIGRQVVNYVIDEVSEWQINF